MRRGGGGTRGDDGRPSFGAVNRAIKNREMGGPLALDGRHLKGGHNNQIKVGFDVGGALERRGGQGGACGGVLSTGTGRRIEGEKKTKIKLVVALDGSRRVQNMQQPTKNRRARWGRDRVRSATVGERRGGCI